MRIIKADYRSEWLYRGRDYVLLDPPWNFDDRPPKAASQVSDRYSVWANLMHTNGSELVGCMANCHYAGVKAVFVWSTWSLLQEVLGAQRGCTIDGALFPYSLKTAVTWLKLERSGQVKYGLGHHFRGCTEPLLVFVHRDAKKLGLQQPNFFSEYSPDRTMKPRTFERGLMTDLPGSWLYMFSGPSVDCFEGFDVDCVDMAHDLEGSGPGLLR